MKKLVGVAIVIVAIFIIGCRKKTADAPILSNKINSDSLSTKTPATYDEWVQSYNLSKQISSAAGPIINNYLNSAIANKTKIDAQSIADKISAIDGVKKAYPDIMGASIIIQQKDGTEFFIIIQRKDNELLYPTIKVTNGTLSSHLKTSGSFVGYYPTGTIVLPTSKKALILAPFQHDFKQDLDVLKGLLQLAGYTVTMLVDTEVTVEKFRGDFLQNYGVIYISTHGQIGTSQFGSGPTKLLTGEHYSVLKHFGLQYAGLVRQCLTDKDNDFHYFGITPEFIKSSMSKHFSKSLVYIDACNSAFQNDLSDMFLSNGAMGFVGYNNTMRAYFNNMVTTELMSGWTNGTNFLLPNLPITVALTATEPGNSLSSLVMKTNLGEIDQGKSAFAIFDYHTQIRDPSIDKLGELYISHDFGSVGDKVGFVLLSKLNILDPNCPGGPPYNCYWQNDLSASVALNFKESIAIAAKTDCNQLPTICRWEGENIVIDNSSKPPYVDTYVYKSFDKSGNLYQHGSITYVVRE